MNQTMKNYKRLIKQSRLNIKRERAAIRSYRQLLKQAKQSIKVKRASDKLAIAERAANTIPVRRTKKAPAMIDGYIMSGATK